MARAGGEGLKAATLWFLVATLMNGTEVTLGSHTERIACERAAARMSSLKPVKCVPG